MANTSTAAHIARRQADLVVVGGGVAGLYAALTAAADGASVLLVAKAPVATSNSWHAQGGVAAALGEGDSPALHAADTLAAGRGLCRPSAVTALTDEAPARIADLVDLGVEFDEGLSREGGHSRRRVVHAGGAATGKAISEVLASRVGRTLGIAVADDVRVLDLWESGGRCVGVITDGGAIAAGATLLATGGYAALWERTTNPAGALGEGLVLAYRAGAALADLEFVQFHPTALLDDGSLLSEALRGEGALLLDDDGDRFTDELAPRDVVARAIAERGSASLDLRAIERERFPGLMATLELAGYDPAVEPIPVSPAAHYTVGGVVTDLVGRSTLPGLYAAGEVACTGVHGANRLASNSLLECLVFGRRAAHAALQELGPAPAGSPPPALERPAVTPEVRRALWQDAGVTRDARGLERLLGLEPLLPRLVATSALSRRESRGAHFRSDFPTEDAAFACHIVLRPGHGPAFDQVDLSREEIARVVDAALAEDVGTGDLTTDRTVPGDAMCSAELLLEEPGIVCGVEIALSVFSRLDPRVVPEVVLDDGARVTGPPARLATIEGPARSVLTGERTASNLLGRLCGIATLTSRFVEAVAGTGTTILDTRKTTPGLRALEKYAVRCGGGTNHRAGLYDAILIKENHIRIAGGVAAAVAAVRAAGDTPVEIEAESLDEVSLALAAGAERILLDNMAPDDVARAVEIVAGQARLEASGGMSLATVRAYADTGVDFISIGALTHSARSLHVSLEVE